MEQYVHFVIGVLTLAGIIAVPVAPFVFILWGGTSWALLILKGDFSNVLAMVMASLLICTGVFFYFKRF